MPPSVKKIRYLNLLAIRLPLPGILSILHRLSGVLLIGALPIALFVLEKSLENKQEYESIVSCLSHSFVKLLTLGVAWSFFHHFCAGIRYLLIDFHIGVDLAAARFSSVVVFVVGTILTLCFGVWLW